MTVWYSEYYPSPEAKLSIKIKDVLYSEQSEYQKIEIYETERLGKLLVLDGYVMLSELDEFVYHEMIVHPAMVTHPAPRKVLVVGGGDGGTIREVLRHKSVEEAYLVEIDEKVSEACQKHIPNVASELNNPKVKKYFQDAVEFVKNSKEKFDVILIDSTDPISIGEGLFTSEFYRNCTNILNNDGILIAQSESAFYTPHLVPNIYKKISSVFDKVELYRATIPTYPSGDWYFTFAVKGTPDRKNIIEKNLTDLLDNHRLKYYNEKIHGAAFALPTFVTELLNS